MFRKRITLVALVVAAYALTAITLTPLGQAAEKTITWKGQSCFGVASPLGQHTIVLWKDFVEQMSGGRLKITLHDVGEIVPGDKIYDAVRDGLLDFGLNTPAYQKGRYPAGDLFYTLPGGIL
jgi:TRAP-type mannitol/chloroaromatic compound transport system substrate-binding protein